MRQGLIFVLAMACALPAYAQTRYFVDIPDLPMPQGFVERSATATFEGERGSVVVVAAEGPATERSVRDFYYECLPQLGWAVSPQTDETLVFLRGRERLTIAASRENDHLLLSVQLVASQAASD